MFSVNDKIHYGSSGVCVIQEIATMRFGRTRERYYVLKPVYQKSSVIYKMRPLLSQDEVDALIASIPTVETAWIDDPQARKASFDELLRSHSCAGLLVIIKTLSAQKELRQARGKSLHVSDDTYLREAQRLLYDEFADALGILPSQVKDYIQDKLQPSA